jgi:hypothetical protein
MTTKICSICYLEKDINEFSKLRKQCKECYKIKQKERHTKWKKTHIEQIKIQQKNWYNNNKEHCSNVNKINYIKNKEKYIETRKKYYRNRDPFITWADMIIHGHEKNGCIIKVNREYLINLARNTTECKICKTKFLYKFGNGYNNKNPSLDRINNEMEIREDNIQIICKLCNTTKNNRSLEEMDQWVKNWISFRNQKV